MNERPIDVLTPFINADSNRTENILVPLNGFLYNRTAAFVINMLSDPDKWITYFPGLTLFYDMSPLQIYKATMYYDVINLFSSIIDPKLLEEGKERYDIIIDSISILDKMDLRNKLVTPLSAYAISQIANERCCEKIIVSKRNRFNSYEEEYLISLFGNSHKKIEMMSGDFFNIWEENKTKLTTIFIDDLSIIDPIAEYVQKEGFDINKHLFLLRMNSKIIELDEASGLYKYNCTDRFKELESMKIHMGTISADPYPIIDNRIPVRSSKK